MTANERRASREEIFRRLRTLLGEAAVQVVETVMQQYDAGHVQEALQTLKEYDSRLGGTGIYSSDGRKLPGIYRALSYVEMLLEDGSARREYGRYMINSSCGYLEELIKRLMRHRPWGVRADRLPLGELVKKIQKRLPSDLAENLKWLNSQVCVFAKHLYNMGREEIAGAPEPEHYFEVDEALAIYLIVRALGRRLEEWSGKPDQTFLRE